MSAYRFITIAASVSDESGRPLSYKTARIPCIAWPIATIAIVLIQTIQLASFWKCLLGISLSAIVILSFASMYLVCFYQRRIIWFVIWLAIVVGLWTVAPAYWLQYYALSIFTAVPAVCWSVFVLSDNRSTNILRTQNYYKSFALALTLAVGFSLLPCIAIASGLQPGQHWLSRIEMCATAVTVVAFLRLACICGLHP
jgi:hypothetical protein